MCEFLFAFSDFLRRPTDFPNFSDNYDECVRGKGHGQSKISINSASNLECRPIEGVATLSLDEFRNPIEYGIRRKALIEKNVTTLTGLSVSRL